MFFSNGAPPPAPTQISPSGSGYSPTPAFTFNTIAGAVGYLIEVDNNGTATRTTSRWYAPAEVDPSSTGIGSITLPSSLAGGSYRWYIIAMNGAGVGPWSAPMYFSVGALLAAKVPSHPFPNLTISPLPNGSFLVEGNGIPGQTYRIQYANDGGGPNWQLLGTVTTDAVGRFSYTDVGGAQQRFYRLANP